MNTVQRITFLLCCFWLAGSAQPAVRYRVTDLGDLSGGIDYSEAYDINNFGTVVGVSGRTPANGAFLWTSDSGMTYLGDLSGGPESSSARSINDEGLIVGESATAVAAHAAFVWAFGSMQNLGDLPGGEVWSEAYGINDFGEVVGYSVAAAGDRAFLYSGGSLNNLAPGTGAFAINNASQVVGDNGGRAFLWSSGAGMKDLGVLPGAGSSIAVDINQLGQVVGSSGNRAFRWTASGGLQNLGVLTGYSHSTALGINNGGQVVGSSHVDPGELPPHDEFHAFVWNSDNGMQDLNALLDSSGAGWTLTKASAINDAGQIVGVGRNPQGLTRAFILDPFEPPSLAVWDSDANGNWSVILNWTSSVPNGAGVPAVLGPVITAPRTVTIDFPVTVGRLVFDSVNAYTIAGNNVLTFEDASGEVQINVAVGSHEISAPVTLANNAVFRVIAVDDNLTLSGGLSAVGKDLAKVGPGTLTLRNVHGARLTINEGTVSVGATSELEASAITGLTIAGSSDAPTSKFDVNGPVVLDYSSASPEAAVRQQIRTGRGGPGFGAPWNELGISSNAVAAANAADAESQSLAYAENATLPLGSFAQFRGEPVDDTTILIAVTRTGDANLDGVVNDDDVTIVGATYAPGIPQASWSLGDFDYNGFVDDEDITLLGAFYDPAAMPIAAPVQGAQVTAVPEPKSILLAIFAFALIAFRWPRLTKAAQFCRV